MEPIELFLTFLKASALALGGGLGSLPLLRADLVLTGIATDEQLVQALAIGRLGTGPPGLYIVSFGYFAGGIVGAVAALIAASIPPLVMVPAAAFARRRLMSPRFAGLLRGTVLATVGLLLAIAVTIIAPTGEALARVTWWQIVLVAGAATATLRGSPHPAFLVAIGAASGIALTR